MAFFVLISASSYSQEMETLVGTKPIHTSGGYGAKLNKFTKIGDSFVNLNGIYGGWYINHKFMIGASVAAIRSDIPVPTQFSADPATNMSYAYAQAGVITEYVLASSKCFHVGFQLFSGTGFTTQYIRDHGHDEFKNAKDTNWFFVSEPGVNVEVNVLKWMRICPGISYRAAFGSNAAGLKDRNINGISLNLSLKLGKF